MFIRNKSEEGNVCNQTQKRPELPIINAELLRNLTIGLVTIIILHVELNVNSHSFFKGSEFSRTRN